MNTRNVLQVDGLMGWGVSLEGNPYQSVCGVHATLLTYDNQGKPMMVFGGLTSYGAGPFTATLVGWLYRPRGTPYGLPHDPSRFELGERVGIWESSSSGAFLKQVRIDIYGITRRLDLSRFYFEY